MTSSGEIRKRKKDIKSSRVCSKYVVLRRPINLVATVMLFDEYFYFSFITLKYHLRKTKCNFFYVFFNRLCISLTNRASRFSVMFSSKVA